MVRIPANRTALPEERRRIIRDRLAADGKVLAADLSRDFGASQDTIRRDLRDLAHSGHCRRVYGGALPLSPASGSLRERQAEAPHRKAALGRAAAALAGSGAVLFIDAGSTNMAIAQALPDDRNLTVATNSPAIAAALADRDGIAVLVIGGRLDRRSGGTYGAAALDEVRRIRADLCFIGACSVAADAGVGAFDSEEAALKRAMAEASVAVAAAVTAEKLGTRAPYFVAAAGRLDYLVVEAGTGPAVLAPFAAAGTRVIVAGVADD